MISIDYVAEFVQELTGADMFKVEPAVPYAADYKTCIEEAKKRITAKKTG